MGLCICRLSDKFHDWYYYFSCHQPTSSSRVNELLRRQLSKLESTSDSTSTWNIYKSLMPSPNHYHKSNTSNFGFFQFACELEIECIDIGIGYSISPYSATCQWQSLECAFFFVGCCTAAASHSIRYLYTPNQTPTNQDWYVYLH